MEEILIYLEAIQKTAKSIHYHSHGLNFFGDHLLMDRIQEPIYDFIDQIKENFYLASGDVPPHEKLLVTRLAEILEDGDPNLDGLKWYLEHTIELLNNECKQHPDSASINDMLGSISSSLANSLGLLNRRLAI